MPAAPRVIDFENYVAEQRPVWMRKVRLAYDTLVAQGSIVPPSQACTTHDYRWSNQAGAVICVQCGEER